MPCEMVSLAFNANLFTTKLKERVIHEGLKRSKIIKVMLRAGKMWAWETVPDWQNASNILLY